MLPIDLLRPGDISDALRLSTQAGWNQTAADWERLRGGAFAGRVDGRLVATSSVVTYGGDAAWIGMILVDEACRGRGFGMSMLRRAVELAGERAGLDATEQGRPLYLKLGFVDVEPIDRWSGVLREISTSPVAAGLPEDIARRDREACGVERSSLLRGLGRAWRVGEQAWACLRPGRLAWHLGPIVADTTASFAALLGEVARALRGAPVLVDAFRTSDNTALLGQGGLSVVRRLTRMTRGRPQRLLMGTSVRAATAFEWG